MEGNSVKMENSREIKDMLYDHVSRIGKAVSSPKRLELIEVLCQGEKSVDRLASEVAISMKLASAHLRELRRAHLVETRREGKQIFYRLADPRVADFWVMLHSLAEQQLTGLREALKRMTAEPEMLEPSNRDGLMRRARAGEVTVIDVRPVDEYRHAHLPFARSMPLDELAGRLDEIPREMPVVAYCRGPYCLMARDAVDLLRQHGYRADQLTDGVAEWQAHTRRS